jgi:hypothetical protein
MGTVWALFGVVHLFLSAGSPRLADRRSHQAGVCGLRLVQEHGPKWTKIGDLMGLTQYQVKNAYTLLNQGKKRNTGARHLRTLIHAPSSLSELAMSAQGLPW